MFFGSRTETLVSKVYEKKFCSLENGVLGFDLDETSGEQAVDVAFFFSNREIMFLTLELEIIPPWILWFEASQINLLISLLLPNLI